MKPHMGPNESTHLVHYMTKSLRTHLDCLQGEIVLSIIAFIIVATQWGRPSGPTPGLNRNGFQAWFWRTGSGLHKTVTPTPSYIFGMEVNVDCGRDLITQHQWWMNQWLQAEWKQISAVSFLNQSIAWRGEALLQNINIHGLKLKVKQFLDLLAMGSFMLLTAFFGNINVFHQDILVIWFKHVAIIFAFCFLLMGSALLFVYGEHVFRHW